MQSPFINAEETTNVCSSASDPQLCYYHKCPVPIPAPCPLIVLIEGVSGVEERYSSHTRASVSLGLSESEQEDDRGGYAPFKLGILLIRHEGRK